MAKLHDKSALFCKTPRTSSAMYRVQRRWFSLVTASLGNSVNRVIKTPLAATQQDIIHIRRLIYVDPPSDELLYEKVWSASRGQAVFEQVFEGEVTAADKEYVIIRFKVDDDLEERRFARKLIPPDVVIKEGQPVRARCYLESIPETPPMPPDQIRQSKDHYRDVDGYLKKAKRGKSLLEDD